MLSGFARAATRISRTGDDTPDVGKGKRNRKSRKEGSRLDAHRRSGKRLIPPLGDLPMSEQIWLRDIFPDMLWIDAVLWAKGE